MDKKAAYLISVGVIIVFALFVTLISHHSGSAAHKGEIVKEELESPEEVKGVFRNIYVVKKEEPVKEEIVFHDTEEAEKIHADAADEEKSEPEALAVEEGVIRMENAAYPEHKKPIVLFTHLGHIEKYKLACGECHHDSKAAPLNNLTLNDKVSGCIECHAKPGQKPRGKDTPELSRSEELAFHAEALHDNCVSCHKKLKESGINAPTSCAKCHAK